MKDNNPTTATQTVATVEQSDGEELRRRGPHDRLQCFCRLLSGLQGLLSPMAAAVAMMKRLMTSLQIAPLTASTRSAG